jgi:hypothetical protein
VVRAQARVDLAAVRVRAAVAGLEGAQELAAAVRVAVGPVAGDLEEEAGRVVGDPEVGARVEVRDLAVVAGRGEEREQAAAEEAWAQDQAQVDLAARAVAELEEEKARAAEDRVVVVEVLAQAAVAGARVEVRDLAAVGPEGDQEQATALVAEVQAQADLAADPAEAVDLDRAAALVVAVLVAVVGALVEAAGVDPVLVAVEVVEQAGLEAGARAEVQELAAAVVEERA